MTIKKLDASYKTTLAEIDKLCMHMPWTEGMFENELSNDATCYVGVFFDDKLAGYGGMWLVCDEAQITNIAVLPEFQRKGLGNAILNELINRATNASFMTLEVRESNIPAISLYEKNGFSADGLRKNYYKSPTENAVLMSLHIKSE